jgi:hypothetical protein
MVNLLAASEIDVRLPDFYSIHTRDTRVSLLASSDVDLWLPHSLEYLF